MEDKEKYEEIDVSKPEENYFQANPAKFYKLDISKVKTVKHVVRVLDAFGMKVMEGSEAYEKIKDLLIEDEQ